MSEGDLLALPPETSIPLVPMEMQRSNQHQMQVIPLGCPCVHMILEYDPGKVSHMPNGYNKAYCTEQMLELNKGEMVIAATSWKLIVSYCVMLGLA